MNAKLILFFLLRFTLVFALLAAPWPGWREAYGEFFLALGQKCLNRPGGNGLAKFTRQLPARDGLDIRIYLTNRLMVDSQGEATATRVEVSSRVIGLIPTALLAALVLATPTPRWQRARALGWGLVWMHGYILAAMFLAMCRQFQIVRPSLGVFESSPFWKSIVEGLYQVTVEYIGARLALAVVIWVLVTFRREDWRGWTQAITAAGRLRAGGR